MTIEKIIIDTELVNDKSDLWIRDLDMHVLAHGNWYQDSILEYISFEVKSFTWQDDNEIYIDILKKAAG